MAAENGGAAFVFLYGVSQIKVGSIRAGHLATMIVIVALLVVGYLIKAPVFFLAVGSQANVGGAASAPVVASAFHPSLATVGVLLAVCGYAVGTIGAVLCTVMMQAASMG